MSPNATVGRNVYFQESADTEQLAAIVTAVNTGETINLCVFQRDGTPVPVQSVPHAEDDIPKPGHWNWMPFQVKQQAKEESAK